MGVVTQSLVPANTAQIPFNFSTVYTSARVVEERSLYWQHLSFGVPQGSATHCQLNGLGDRVVITTTTTQMPDDRVTADTLQWIQPLTPMSVSNQEALFSSSSLQETAWLGFRLDGRFDPLVAFFAQTVFGSQNNAAASTIFFATNPVNEGGAWNNTTSIFTAPTTGDYVFAYSAMVPPYISGSVLNVYVNILVNGATVKQQTIFHDYNYPNYQLIRGIAMLNLTKNDKVLFQSAGLIAANSTYYAQVGMFYLIDIKHVF